MDWTDQVLNDLRISYQDCDGSPIRAIGIPSMVDMFQRAGLSAEECEITISPVFKADTYRDRFVHKTEALKEWIQTAKQWIAGDGRSSEKEVQSAQDKLDKRSKGILVGPRQRCVVLKDEGYDRNQWPTEVPVLSRILGLSCEQEHDLMRAANRDSSERYYRQDDILGHEARTRIIRYRTKCEGAKIHLVYGFCELAWEIQQVSDAALPSFTWGSKGGDVVLEHNNRLMRLIKEQSADYHSVRASRGISSGVLEWEIMPYGKNSSIIAGVCNVRMPLDQRGHDFWAGCIGLETDGNFVRDLCGQPHIYSADMAFSVNDVLRFRLDMGNGTLLVSKNGRPTAEASGLQSLGPLYPFASVDYTGEACWIRSEAKREFTTEIVHEMQDYAERRAEYQFALQLQIPASYNDTSGMDQSAAA